MGLNLKIYLRFQNYILVKKYKDQMGFQQLNNHMFQKKELRNPKESKTRKGNIKISGTSVLITSDNCVYISYMFRQIGQFNLKV